MIELLDSFIGPNLATYIGTFLTIIAFVIPVKRALKNKQKIRSGNNAKNIQVNGSININEK